MSASVYGAGGGGAWRDGQYLGEVVAIDAEVEVPSITVERFGPILSMTRAPFRWWNPRHWWARFRHGRVYWRESNLTRSGTLRVQAVDSRWTMTVMDWLHPGWRFAKMHVLCALLGRAIALWLLWRAWRGR